MEIKETKTNKTVFYIIIFALIFIAILMLTSKCNSEKVLVNIPAISGSTPISKPIQETLVITKDSLIFKYIPITTQKEYDYWKSEAERIEFEKSEKILAFKNANDSLKQLLYAKANTQNEFFNEWDNDTINAQVYGFNTGEIHSMQLKYTIKERNQLVKSPQTVIRVLAGIETGMTKDLSKFNIKANLAVQNKQGNIFSASFDSDQRIYLGYTTSIFQIKK